MENFRISIDAGREYAIRVHEVDEPNPDLVRTLIDIDLQTFSESTFSHYTAAAFLRMGRVFLLNADDIVIGSCVCMRVWERPNEALILSMGIRPGWRGRGLGQRFLRGVLDKLQARGLRAVSLMVSEENRRALRVYGDVGFEITEDPVLDPRTGERFVQMRRALHPPAVTALPSVDSD